MSSEGKKLLKSAGYFQKDGLVRVKMVDLDCYFTVYFTCNVNRCWRFGTPQDFRGKDQRDMVNFPRCYFFKHYTPLCYTVSSSKIIRFPNVNFLGLNNGQNKTFL